MRKVFILSAIAVFILSCGNKSMEIDGVVFTKLDRERGIWQTVQTSEIVEDSLLLVRAVSVLGLDTYSSITFQDESGRMYGRASRVFGGGFAYDRFTPRSAAEIAANYVSSIIHDGTKSAIISEHFVKSKLSHPRESRFRTSAHTHEVEGNQAVVMNRFTARNAFGVTSEYVYKIWLSHKGGEWEDVNNWTYSRLVIENSATGEQTVFDNRERPTTDTSVVVLGEIDGITLTVIERNDSMTRITTSRRLSENQIKKAVSEFEIRTNLVYFHLPNNTARGSEYAFKNRDLILIY